MLLRDALENAGQVAITKIAIRQRESLAALRVRDGVLVLHTMRWPDEIRRPDFAFLDEDITVRPQELKMAEALISSMSGDFDPSEFTDDYREAMTALLEAKQSGGEVQPVPEVADDGRRGRRPDERAAPQRRAGPRRVGADDDAGDDAAAEARRRRRRRAAKKAPAKKAAAGEEGGRREEDGSAAKTAGEEDRREARTSPGQARPPQRLTCPPPRRRTTRSPSTAPSGIRRGRPSRCPPAGQPLPAGTTTPSSSRSTTRRAGARASGCTGTCAWSATAS